MQHFFHKLIRSFRQGVCLSHLSPINWEGTALRCPQCQKLIAYVFPLHEKYMLHITYPYCLNPQWCRRIQDTLPVHLLRPPVTEPVVQIEWELLRDPVEPLASDSWDSDEDYQNYIKQQIKELQNRNEDDFIGKPE